jgi:hypothetical protein
MNSLIDNAFDAVSDNQWANYCKHAEHTEQEMWKADNLQDDVGPLIVQLPIPPVAVPLSAVIRMTAAAIHRTA